MAMDDAAMAPQVAAAKLSLGQALPNALWTRLGQRHLSIQLPIASAQNFKCPR
jgi:hypothetical protein